MVRGEKKSNVVADFYGGLGKSEKGLFVLWVQLKTGWGHSTVISRIGDDRWSPVERECIIHGMESGEWRNVRS